MSNRQAQPFTTPPGRLVWGSVHKPRVQKDNQGNPKLIKSGENAGKPLAMIQFGTAIPKTMAHWKDEPPCMPGMPAWGAVIFAEAAAAWPGGQTQRPDFSWKITDGDSTIPNKNQKRPCDQEGYRGHWILSFSGMSAPQILNAVDGTLKQSNVPDLINPGDYVQVSGSVVGNDSTQTAGVYLNHGAVCLRGFGERIIVAAEADISGFGVGIVAGASAMPTGSAAFAGAPVSAPPVPAPAVASPPAVAAQPPTPYAGHMTPPPVPSAVPVPPPAKRMTPQANGLTYEQYVQAGWSDAQMIQSGFLEA